MPRAPPPPRTSPIDFPHILLASREKSLACGSRCGRGSEAPPRYFWISLCTLSLRFLMAVTASGPLETAGDFGMGTMRPYRNQRVSGQVRHTGGSYIQEARHGCVDESMVDSAISLSKKKLTKNCCFVHLQPFTSRSWKNRTIRVEQN